MAEDRDSRSSFSYASSVKQNVTERSTEMEQIPDDPIVRQIEETGWPWWMQ
jgi:hypothetical protein